MSTDPLKKLRDRINDPSSLLKAVGKMMQANVKKNIDTRGRNLGVNWPFLNPQYRRQKVRQGYSAQTLIRKGDLLRTVVSSTPVINTNERSVTASSNLPYARIHHTGGVIQIAARSELFTRNRYKRGDKKGKFKKGTKAGQGHTIGAHQIRIPARPYMALADHDVNEIKQTVVQWLLR